MQDKTHNTLDLFNSNDTKKADILMNSIDKINSKLGSQTLRTASSIGKGKWIAKKDSKSNCYTTRWDELSKIKD